jgi:hypothetical protein
MLTLVASSLDIWRQLGLDLAYQLTTCEQLNLLTTYLLFYLNFEKSIGALISLICAKFRPNIEELTLYTVNTNLPILKKCLCYEGLIFI